MALDVNYEGQYVVTCGDRFEAGVSMARGTVTSEVGGLSVTSTVDPNSISIKHANEILDDRMFSLTAEFRGEPIVIWPLSDWEEYASRDFVLPEST